LGHSVITTESNLTRDLYIKSLEESLAAAHEYVTKDMAARAAPPPANEQLTLLYNDLNAQCKQFELVMEENSKLLAALSKGGRGGRDRGGSGSGGSKKNGGVANNSGSACKGGSSSGGGSGGHGGGGEKTLPKLQQMGSTFPCGVFLLGSKQKQTPAEWKAKPPA
jgi:hypothetical protein